MTTKKQLLSTIAIGAALVAASTLIPDKANAWWWNYPPRSPGGGAPEVDPSTLGSALALAVGGWAVLSDKLRRR